MVITQSVSTFMVLWIVGASAGETHTSTASFDSEPFRFRIEFEVTWEGKKKEGGSVHPDVAKLHVSKILWRNLGAFAFAHVGKARSELYGGLHIDALRGILFDSLLHIELELGAGIGVGGVPIVGAGFSIEDDRGLVFRVRGHYHYATGIYEEADFRFRALPATQLIEPWIGVFQRMSGLPQELFGSLEAGPMAGALVHWPKSTLLWAAWPFRVGEVRTHIRLTFGLECEF